jgi:hypothetical protein
MGDLTESGKETVTSTTRQWRGRIGIFMMMGGFPVVLIAFIAILFIVSVLIKSQYRNL